MAFGGQHKPQNPYSEEVGEIWSSEVTLPGAPPFGVVFTSENQVASELSTSQLGLNLDPATGYLVTKYSAPEFTMELDPG